MIVDEDYLAAARAAQDVPKSLETGILQDNVHLVQYV